MAERQTLNDPYFDVLCKVELLVEYNHISLLLGKKVSVQVKSGFCPSQSLLKEEYFILQVLVETSNNHKELETDFRVPIMICLPSFVFQSLSSQKY